MKSFISAGLITIIMFAFIGGNIVASGVPVLEYLSTALEGQDITDVDILGGRAFVIQYDANLLSIIDISVPGSPSVIGQTEIYHPADIRVRDNFAYVTAPASGLNIVDISDPVNPAVVGNFSTETNTEVFDIIGNLAYLSSYAEGLQIVDISNPASPSLMGEFTFPHEWSYIFYEPIQAVAVEDNYAFCAMRTGGLMVFDVSDPVIPEEVTILDYDPDYYSFYITIDGNYAYVPHSMHQTMSIVDISNPDAPTLAARWTFDCNPMEVKKIDEYLYIPTECGIMIYDVESVNSPLTVGNYSTEGKNSCIAFGNGVVLVSGSNGLRIYSQTIAPYKCEIIQFVEIGKITDASYILNSIFFGGTPLVYEDAGDINLDGSVNIADASFIIKYIFGF